jgi:hypothetical protein
MLQVVTHNGKPPSEGGLRLGYLFTTAEGGTGVVPASLAALFQAQTSQPPQPTKPSAKPSPAVLDDGSNDIPEVHRDPEHGDVHCRKCSRYTPVIAGKRGMVICRGCGRSLNVVG